MELDVNSYVAVNSSILNEASRTIFKKCFGALSGEGPTPGLRRSFSETNPFSQSDQQEVDLQLTVSDSHLRIWNQVHQRHLILPLITLVFKSSPTDITLQEWIDTAI
ncbi:hypothetical protein Tcan_12916 [Toxocara canis]|uniref:Uncharacterized protein n=1 Tax=Toxocara canis TaxID=6265 RepID=A0A0B2VZS7_TOXCA|nr:hypothetical protein Tcan_12916 [Toxocara canis]